MSTRHWARVRFACQHAEYRTLSRKAHQAARAVTLRTHALHRTHPPVTPQRTHATVSVHGMHCTTSSTSHAHAYAHAHASAHAHEAVKGGWAAPVDRTARGVHAVEARSPGGHVHADAIDDAAARPPGGHVRVAGAVVAARSPGGHAVVNETVALHDTAARPPGGHVRVHSGVHPNEGAVAGLPRGHAVALHVTAAGLPCGHDNTGGAGLPCGHVHAVHEMVTGLPCGHAADAVDAVADETAGLPCGHDDTDDADASAGLPCGHATDDTVDVVHAVVHADADTADAAAVACDAESLPTVVHADVGADGAVLHAQGAGAASAATSDAAVLSSSQA